MTERKVKARRREAPWLQTMPVTCTVLTPDELPAIECPAKMPGSAKHVASVCWSWSPANDRLDTYYLTSNSGRTHWILWFSFQDPEDYKQIRVPRAYCSKKGLSDKDAAMFLLFMMFRREQDAGEDPGSWAEVTPGLLSSEQLSVLATMLWALPKGELR